MGITEVVSNYLEERRPRDVALDVVAVGGLALIAKTVYDALSHREPKKNIEEEV